MTRTTWRKDDPTKTAVKRQLTALDLVRYEIGLCDVATGRMVQRHWSASEILSEKNLGWLKWMNRYGDGGEGSHVYIRGDRTAGTNSGLILVDDIGLTTIQNMEEDGVAPAALVQTSPMNYQVWVRVSETPLPRDEATALAKLLAERYGGDPNSADWCHYGRLAGFTNRKPHHIQANGLSPFVLFERGRGDTARAAASLLTEARERVKTGKDKSPAPLLDPLHDVGTPEEKQTALQYFQEHWSRYAAEYGGDESRADWHLCRALAQAGYSPSALHYALRHGSPNVAERKKGHVEGKATAYVDLTISNVLKQPDICAARTQIQHLRGESPPPHP